MTAAVDDRVPVADQFRWLVPDEPSRRRSGAAGKAVRRVRGDGTEVWAGPGSDGDISPLVAMSIGWWAVGLPAPSALSAVR